MPRLEPAMARIRVKDLRLRTYIGIKEEEILNRQDVLINLTMLYPAAEAVRENDIEQALNYRTITKAIIQHVEDNRFALLERLTQAQFETAGDDWLVETHMQIQGKALDHKALAGFVSGLFTQEEVADVRVQRTTQRQAGDTKVVEFDLTVVLKSRVEALT